MSKKVAYVTGGMGGIGTAICQRLHKDGFTVIAGCGPTRDYGKWLAEQKAQGCASRYRVAHMVAHPRRMTAGCKLGSVFSSELGGSKLARVKAAVQAFASHTSRKIS